MEDLKDFLTNLDLDEHFPIPEKFTYPFFYQSEELSELAATDLQNRLENKVFKDHVFTSNSQEEISKGKMFGVLVVQLEDESYAYLSAFSGKIGKSNHFKGFVPPVYDLLSTESFFVEEYKIVSDLITQVNSLKKNKTYKALQSELTKLKDQELKEISSLKELAKAGKLKRRGLRKSALEDLNEEEYKSLETKLANESIAEKLAIKRQQAKFGEQINALNVKLAEFETALKALTSKRAEESNKLQGKIFKHYTFLNARKEEASLLDIFNKELGALPPAGAGECSAPKLLQFAYRYNLKPIAMLEFWWGASPKSEVRKHKQFYPACRSKCLPILSHMLVGLNVKENPLLTNPSLDKKIEILHEEESFLIINKPAGLLSVPGKQLKDSVQKRMEEKYPESKDNLIVHRLDMATSGIMILAKTKMSHKHLQRQFENRKVNKRYIALLDGILKWQEGNIELPLRVNIDDRPRQIVCEEHGKKAFTHYKIIERRKGKTKVYFYPKTGRTHQLRVHAAHVRGLNLPIVGDDLYGHAADRLHLHAEHLEFYHPITNERVSFTVPCEF